MSLNSKLAYAAGLLDADGTIGIKKNTYGMRVLRNSSQPGYSERIHIRQVQREGIEVLQELFGGTIGIEDSSAKRGKPLFRWGLTDKKAAAALTQLLPHLRIKREQAINCLALRQVKERSKKARVAKNRGHVGAARRPTEISNEMETCYTRAKQLNKVGA